MTLYADNTVLYIDPFPPFTSDVFQSDVNKIDAGLRLNANKPKVVVFSHKKFHPAVNIKVDNTAVPVTDSTCFLGVTITSASCGTVQPSKCLDVIALTNCDRQDRYNQLFNPF